MAFDFFTRCYHVHSLIALRPWLVLVSNHQSLIRLMFYNCAVRVFACMHLS
jgi:hypothetical protein